MKKFIIISFILLLLNSCATENTIHTTGIIINKKNINENVELNIQEANKNLIIVNQPNNSKLIVNDKVDIIKNGKNVEIKPLQK